jgi:DNA-binding transcriptional ArsR family regulator
MATEKEKQAKTERGAKRKRERTLTERAAYALSHKVRVRALMILVERVASPIQIARDIGLRLQTVVYHVGILYDEGLIDLVDTREGSGPTEHFYRAAVRPEISHAEWLKLSDTHKDELCVIGAQNLFAEYLGSVEAGAMRRDDEVYQWWMAPLLDRQGREEVKIEQDGHVARILNIVTRANARVVGSGGKLKQAPTVIAVLGFDRGRPGPLNEIVPDPL